MDDLDAFVKLSGTIPGWTRAEEAEALAQLAHELPDGAVVVEIGSFCGSGAVLLAGARKVRGSGVVHCVDPFDGSGDAFSVPHYKAVIGAHGGRPLRQLFDENIRGAGLADWIETHQGLAHEITAGWSRPIDLLFMDGDQSPAGARAAFDSWSPWVRPGGVVALHNSSPRHYDADHDGHYRLAVEDLQSPGYDNRRLVGSITFARKVLKL